MTRIKEFSTVHFRNPANAKFTLCGRNAFEGQRTLFGGGAIYPLKETGERVNCPDCAKVVCAIRNEHYNALIDSFDAATMMRGVYAAANPDGKVVVE